MVECISIVSTIPAHIRKQHRFDDVKNVFFEHNVLHVQIWYTTLSFAVATPCSEFFQVYVGICVRAGKTA